MQPVLGNDLDRLLEAEERLAGRMAEARAAAERLLEAARVEASELARRGEEVERAGRARLEAQIEGEVAAELRRIEAGAEERVRAYASVTPEQLRELSLGVLRELLGSAAGEGRR